MKVGNQFHQQNNSRRGYQDTSPYNVENRIKSQGALGFYASLSNNKAPSNLSYFEKDENQVRIPTKIYEEHKKKKIKKSPKRTIQRIIKKGKNRSRKIYVNPITRQPTVTAENFEIMDSGYTHYEDITTSTTRKKSRKSSRVARYPMPFHKLQQRKDLAAHYRNRRQVDRDDVFILKDLDEIEFVKKGKDYDVVEAHVKKYW
ncbi:uncharacterized protein LOC126778293 isoform X2 [Nymphalis io]|uniref:uncharacterized protein LOC126778293 isoform X2 n=1 Tax=Inachis io TaxID=171585 RepID=UPI0021690972|nr:uncharacterized protein LOC126778293 isoform X2 [Nymphalis io]